MKHTLKCLPLLLATALPVQAQEGNGPMEVPKPVMIVLDRYTGCWHNRQGDFDFQISIRNSGYLMIELREPEGSVDANEWLGGRDPFLNWLNPSGYVLGMVPLEPFGTSAVVGRVTDGLYGIGWGPRAKWGDKVLMTVCFRTRKDAF